MKVIAKVEITIGYNSYYDFVLADSQSNEDLRKAVAESLWVDPHWIDDIECEWDQGAIHGIIDRVTPIADEELKVLKKFGVV